MIYRLILKLRHALYDKGILNSYSTSFPSICIGNVAVGGAGKTPHTEMLLRMLLNDEEWKSRSIAVLSLGYKRKSRGFQQVLADGSAREFGDEPLQIKKKFPGVTVAVDKDRVKGCAILANPASVSDSRHSRKCKHKDFPAADLVVLDDAFQYRKLKAKLNIVLVDYNHPLSSDSLLPYGRLRDLPERLSHADIIVATKCPAYLTDWDRTSFIQSLGVKISSQKVFFTTIEYTNPAPVYDSFDIRYTYGKRAIVFSGIADDTPFVRYLSDSYKITKHFKFPDHHSFSGSDINSLVSASKAAPTAALVTTEKDAQRVLDNPKVPQMLQERLFQVPIKACFFSQEEEDQFKSAVLEAIRS